MTTAAIAVNQPMPSLALPKLNCLAWDDAGERGGKPVIA
jgi:hypothetical protein